LKWFLPFIAGVIIPKSVGIYDHANLSSKSDIDWSKSVPEINKQLYAKYGLSKEEIDFIEEEIKPMD